MEVCGGNTMKNMERRFAEIKELRAKDDDGKLIISGYPIVYNQEADIGPFREVILPGASREALSISDEFVLFNHNPDYPLARRKNGTLTAVEDEKGVFIEADVSGSPEGRSAHEKVKSGLIDKMSFAFKVQEDEWVTDDNPKELRRIRAFDELFDYSIVVYPAYKATEVQARSAEEVMKSREVSAEAEQSGAPDDGVDFEAVLEPYYKEIEAIEGEIL